MYIRFQRKKMCLNIFLKIYNFFLMNLIKKILLKTAQKKILMKKIKIFLQVPYLKQSQFLEIIFHSTFFLTLMKALYQQKNCLRQSSIIQFLKNEFCENATLIIIQVGWWFSWLKVVHFLQFWNSANWHVWATGNRTFPVLV